MATLTLKLGSLSRDTLSMSRLAVYLRSLASLYGDAEHVHFDSVTDGSAELNANVDDEAYEDVLRRLESAPRSEGTTEANAYHRLSLLMAADETEGEVLAANRKVIDFPRPEPESSPMHITKYGAVQGRLYNLGGKDDTNPVKIEGANGETLLCDADPDTAKQLSPMLFEHVRVHGKGTWIRQRDRGWSLKKLHIYSFEQLREESLCEAVDRIRHLNKRETA